MLFVLLLSCTRGAPLDTSSTCREQTIIVSDWIDSAAEAECSYFTRCLDSQYPGYGESMECPGESKESHISYTEDGEKCVDPCLAEEFLSAYLDEDCVEWDSAKPLPYSFAYTDCVIVQGL